MFKSFVGIVLGGIVAFAWSSISWVALPFHAKTLNQFSNEAAVVDAMKAGAAESGIYIIPGDMTMSEEAKTEAMKNGPFVFASVRPGADEDHSMGQLMVRGLLATIVCALIIGIMLGAAAPGLNYIGRVLFVTLGGLFAGLAAAYPNNIWWEFSVGFTGLAILDLVVGWFLAGLVMAGFQKG